MIPDQFPYAKKVVKNIYISGARPPPNLLNDERSMFKIFHPYGNLSFDFSQLCQDIY